MSVFSDAGECLWMSGPDEWDASEFTGPAFSGDWGVDTRGWLWCHGGETAFAIPELRALHLAPARLQSALSFTGLEPTMGEEK